MIVFYFYAFVTTNGQRLYKELVSLQMFSADYLLRSLQLKKQDCEGDH